VKCLPTTPIPEYTINIQYPFAPDPEVPEKKLSRKLQQTEFPGIPQNNGDRN
jgi:hypothetical protein